ncbi:MAG: 16S rRNA (cytidine(1402)-2'-O)-methyltransferase [Candidatus Paceibacterota bacterium]|jgi:16S rRNA (cytidine1402-2'-O)-methyltransferase
MTTFFIVATPIGNLEDITLRAIRVLGEVDAILCEDTRVTAKLLSRYEIKKPLIRYDAHSTDATLKKIFGLIEEGKSLALVSDAGTPAISDPGSHLVGKLRERFSSEEISIVTIPGPSALTSALSVAGIPASEFLFLGFLPHKKGRETIFKEIVETKRPVIFYESPHRISKALDSLKKFCPERKIIIGRELTKIHEEMLFGTADELILFFEKNKEKIRGEFVVIVN